MPSNLTKATTQETHALTLRETAEAIVKHFGIHEGLYDLLVEFNIGIGAVGPTPEATSPGAVIGVSKIGIVKVSAAGCNTVDAAVCNPAKSPKRPSSKSKESAS